MTTFSKVATTLLAAISTVIAVSCTTTRPTSATKPGEAEFEDTVRPLIEHRCVWCHSNRSSYAGLNFQQPSIALDPELKFIIPGDPQNSRVFRAVKLKDSHPNVMPGDGWGITTEQQDALEKWISAGAPWPEGRAGRIKRRPYRVEVEGYL